MNIARLVVVVLGALLSICAYGQDGAAHAKQSAQLVSYGDVLQWLVALLLVLAVFAGFVWLLKKSGHLALAGKNPLSVVSGLSLGVREKLVLVNVGEKQLLLGVTPGRIDKLLELEGNDRLCCDPTNTESQQGLFAQKLQQVLQGKRDV